MNGDTAAARGRRVQENQPASASASPSSPLLAQIPPPRIAASASSPSSSPSCSPPPDAAARRRPPAWLLAVLLIVIPLLSVNNFFAYHAPGAIGSSMQRVFGLSAPQFGSLFTAYSAPNIVLVFFGGILVDRFGVVPCSLAFNTLMLAGMVLFAVAPAEPERDLQASVDQGVAPVNAGVRASDHSMVYMLVGRLLLGVGGECLCAAASAMLARWFRGSSWLTFACGFNQAFVQTVGSAAVFLLLPKLVRSGGSTTTSGPSSAESPAADAPSSSLAADPALDASVRLCLWVTVGVCVVSLATNLCYALLQWRYAYALPPEEDEPALEEARAEGMDVYEPIDDEGRALLSSPREGASSASLGPMDRLRAFTTLFWIVLTMHCLLSPILYTLTAFGPLSLMERYSLSEEDAGSATALLYGAIVLSPPLGVAVDLTGRRSWWQVVAASAIPVLLGLMRLTDISPYILMGGLGVAYAVTESNGLAMIAVVVRSSSLGTAYGLVGCGVSLALLGEPYAVGLIKSQTGSYAHATDLFILVSAAGAAMSIVVAYYDLNHAELMWHEPGYKEAFAEKRRREALEQL